MAPLPYPHRVTFLASTWIVPPEHAALVPYFARLIAVIVFDHLVHHPVVTLGDLDDERLTDDSGRLLDASHPELANSLDWLFRVSRRHEVLGFELSIDPARPHPPVLRSRQPRGDGTEDFTASPNLALSQQLGQCLARWLTARRLPSVGLLPPFVLDDLHAAAIRLAACDERLTHRGEAGSELRALIQPPARLAVPFLRVLSVLSRDDAPAIDPTILALEPSHPVARRNRYVAGLATGDIDRRAILPMIRDAPMYAKPHLSIWGAPFAADRPLENMGVRHQGIAASLMPGNPYACHNYSLQLAEVQRREESYRWADRATVVAPELGAAHLDCVRRLRQVGRPGQAFAEAQYRCREILDRTAAGTLAGNDWQAPHHAGILLAFAHLDVGRLAEAIELADEVVARLPDDPAARGAFAWATRRIAHWKTDPELFARCYAREGHHRGEVGRVLAGASRIGMTDEEDAMMLIDALCTTGRADQAAVAYWHCAGQGDLLGDGKTRLAAAGALILTGQLDEAIDQIQIVELRRGQSRLEAEINRVLRLAASQPASAWDAVIARRLARGATTLAQLAARDLCDFVPSLDTETTRAALGECQPLAIDPAWIAELCAATPAAQSSAAAIVARLAPPADATLAAADALAADWWIALVPAARDRDAHAAGALLALGLAVAHYLAAASGPPSPIAGGYRHIATEALHLVRRARYQIDPAAIAGLLRTIDRLGAAPEWLLDTWLLRIERALDLEAEHGSFLDGMISDMPVVQRLLRGDERIGWELRLAHDLAEDPSQYPAAAALFARSARAVEAGCALRAWSAAAAAAGPAMAVTGAAGAAARLDVHWTAALAHPTGVAEPWIALARGLIAAGHPRDGFDAACRAMAQVQTADRGRALAELMPAFTAGELAIPLDGALALELGATAAAQGRLDAAIDHLRWAAAVAPDDPGRGHSLAIVLARAGRAPEALRQLARHDRLGAPRVIARAVLERGRYGEAATLLGYAARWFRVADDWALLATTAHGAGDDATCIHATRQAIALGSRERGLLVALATSLYRIGEFTECEQLAHQLIGDADRRAKLAGLHAMARALAGQSRHVEALRYAQAAGELGPDDTIAAELAETLHRIVAQEAPPVPPGAELARERRAAADLEAGRFDLLVDGLASPSWAVARLALAACEVRRDDESGIPVAPRALDAARAILARSAGALAPDAALARIRALRIRDNAFIQIDPPPPLGARYTAEQFERGYAERTRRPERPGAVADAGGGTISW